MQVRTLSPDETGAFHAFIKQCEYGDVLQTAGWARLKAGSGWRAHYLSVEEGRNTVGACLALERRIPRSPFTILYCPRGPVMDWQRKEVFQEMTNGLKALAARQKAILVKIDPPLPTAGTEVESWLKETGYRKVSSDGFGGTQPKCVMKLSLADGLEAAMESFKPKWRYNIRLAERKGVEVHEEGAEGIDRFYDILLETAKRDRFLVRGRTYFHDMFRELNKDGMIRLFLTTYEGETISGSLMYVLGEQAWYTYGASSNQHRNVMPNHLMQWRMMEAAHQAGCTVYDFRGVSCKQDETDVDDHLQGLNRFKAGFNAEFVEYIGEYDLPVNKSMYFAWTKLAPKVMQMIKRKASTSDQEAL